MATTMEEVPGRRAGDGGARGRLGLLAAFAAVYTYLLMVFGGIVRITGSGMGCGDDWPRCNGRWIPVFTLETLIEYMHRLLAAGIGLVVLALVGLALLWRNEPGMRGRDGLLAPSVLAAGLVIVQALLGAVTVWLELPTAVTVAHFLTAMLFLATLVTIAVRAGFFGEPEAGGAAAEQGARTALLTTAAGALVLGLGAVTANTPGASAACTGFPLCNGQWLPQAGATTVLVHWLHRFAAFAWFAAVLAAWRVTSKAGPGSAVRSAATLAALLVTAQIAVAAGLVLMRLPQGFRAAHLAVGVGIWFVLAVWTAVARRERRAALTT